MCLLKMLFKNYRKRLKRSFKTSWSRKEEITATVFGCFSLEILQILDTIRTAKNVEKRGIALEAELRKRLFTVNTFFFINMFSYKILSPTAKRLQGIFSGSGAVATVMFAIKCTLQK